MYTAGNGAIFGPGWMQVLEPYQAWTVDSTAGIDVPPDTPLQFQLDQGGQMPTELSESEIGGEAPIGSKRFAMSPAGNKGADIPTPGTGTLPPTSLSLIGETLALTPDQHTIFSLLLIKLAVILQTESITDRTTQEHIADVYREIFNLIPPEKRLAHAQKLASVAKGVDDDAGQAASLTKQWVDSQKPVSITPNAGGDAQQVMAFQILAIMGLGAAILSVSPDERHALFTERYKVTGSHSDVLVIAGERAISWLYAHLSDAELENLGVMVIG